MSARDETGPGPAGTQIAAQIAPLPRVSIQVFCETGEVAQAVQAASADRRMDKAHVKVQMGGVAAASEAYVNAPTPNVIVIETQHGRAQLLAGLEALSGYCDPETRVVVVGHLNDVQLYRELMRNGVSEYMIAPVEPLDLVRALSELFRAPGSNPVGRTIAVIGAKGGVGASTVSHNLAWTISRQYELNTVIVDLDLAFGTAGLDFNQDPPQGVADAVFAPDRLDAGLVDRLLSKCSDRLSLLAAPSTLERTYDLPEGAFDTVLDILRANIPCVVLDVPHAWTGWARRLALAADEIVVVAGPDLANLRNAKNMMDVFRAARPNDAQPKLVLNGVGLPKRPEIKPQDFAKALEVTPLAVLPFDAATFGAAANNGQMVAEASTGAKVVEIFGEIAQAVTGRIEVKRGRKSVLDPFLARIQAGLPIKKRA